MKNRLLFIVVGIIILLPRIVEFNVFHHFFGIEQANEILTTKRIVIDHQLSLIGQYAMGENSGIYRSPFWNYALIPAFILGNGNPLAFKIFMLITSSLLIFLSFFALKKLLPTITTFVALLLISISPILLELSIKIWPPNIVPFLMPLYIVSLYNISQKNHNAIFAFVAIFAVITHLEYAVAARHAMILLPLFVYYVYRKIIPVRFAIAAIVLYTLSFASLIAYYVQADSLRFFASIPQQISTREVYYSFFEFFNSLIWIFRSTFSTNIYFSILIASLIIGFSSYLVYSRKTSKSESFLVKFSAGLVLTTIIQITILRGNVVSWWVYDLPIFFILVFSIIITYLLRTKAKILGIMLIVVITAIQAENIYKKATTTHISPDLSAYIPQLLPIDYIFRQEKGDFAVKVISRHENINDFIYLFWWRGHAKYKRKASFLNSNEYYLIIDTQLDEKQKQKLQKMVQGEKLISRKIIENQYIVEKRSFSSLIR